MGTGTDVGTGHLLAPEGVHGAQHLRQLRLQVFLFVVERLHLLVHFAHVLLVDGLDVRVRVGIVLVLQEVPPGCQDFVLLLQALDLQERFERCQ